MTGRRRQRRRYGSSNAEDGGVAATAVGTKEGDGNRAVAADVDDAQDGQLASRKQLERTVESVFPQEHVVYAFGYGSGVFAQAIIDDDDKKKKEQNETNVIDVILAVDDAYRFHRANLSKNPDHYVRPWVLGRNDAARRATWVQRHDVDNRFFRNPKVYFNLAPDEGIKYGVVQVEDLCDDLRDWKYLYLAGRMQKPTVEILDRQPPDRHAQTNIRARQQRHNLPAALASGILFQSTQQLLDDPGAMDGTGNTSSFRQQPLSSVDVYTQIAALSYGGDIRVTIGAEDPNKVQKLVQSPGQYERFTDLYRTSVQELHNAGILSIHDNDDNHNNNQSTTHPNHWTWDATDPAAHRYLWSKLPEPLQQLRPRGGAAAAVDLRSELAAVRALRRAVECRIVAPAARYQSLKGPAMAGARRSALYAARKLSKGWL